MTLGDDDARGEVEHVMSSHHTVNVRAVLGAGRHDAKEVRILNRYACWNPMVKGVGLSTKQILDTLS